MRVKDVLVQLFLTGLSVNFQEGHEAIRILQHGSFDH